MRTGETPGIRYHAARISSSWSSIRGRYAHLEKTLIAPRLTPTTERLDTQATTFVGCRELGGLAQAPSPVRGVQRGDRQPVCQGADHRRDPRATGDLRRGGVPRDLISRVTE